MTSQMAYFGEIFPANPVLRLIKGVTGSKARYLVASRAPKFYVHFPAVTVAQPSDVANLLLFAHYEDKETGNAVKIVPNRPWYCTTLHLGWALHEHTRLVNDPHTRDDRHLDENSFELVLDLDLPDVEKKRPRNAIFPIRGGFLCQCAKMGTGCCRGCWLLVRLTKRALSLIVPSTWGPPLWVYSGGKGAHCIYGSEEARALPLELRHAFVDNLNRVISGSEKPPDSFADALRAAWEEIGVREAKVLASDEACRILANAFLVQGSSDHAKFIKGLALTPDSVQRWSLFIRIGGAGLARRVACELSLLPVDEGPLTNRNGRIKCPFSLHMTTHRVALPLTDEQFERFDPAHAVSIRMGPTEMRTAMKDSIAHFVHWLNTNKYTTI